MMVECEWGEEEVDNRLGERSDFSLAVTVECEWEGNLFLPLVLGKADGPDLFDHYWYQLPL